MNTDEMTDTLRSMLAELLGIDEARVTVAIRPDAGHTRVTILVDGAEPQGRHRELISEWARRTGGHIMGQA